MGNAPVKNVDPDGGSIGSWVRLFLQALNLVRPATPAVGQFSGVAQATSLSGSTAAGTSGGGSGTGGGLLNSLGNAAASALGQWVANKLLPMPSGADAGQLQNMVTNEQQRIASIFSVAANTGNGSSPEDDGSKDPLAPPRVFPYIIFPDGPLGTPKIWANANSAINLFCKPDLLTYKLGIADENRKIACGRGRCFEPAYWCEEYPLACTEEGGVGAIGTTACVDVYEQLIQRTQIAALISMKNGMRSGDKIKVILVQPGQPTPPLPIP